MNKAMLDLRARLELMSKQYPMLSAVGAGIDKAIREIDDMLAAAPKPEAQAAGVDVRARYFLASGLDEYGHHSEAQNVRDGEDLESYRHELFAIKAALSTPASHDAQQPDQLSPSEREQVIGRLREVYAALHYTRHYSMGKACGRMADGLAAKQRAVAQQPAVVGDGAIGTITRRDSGNEVLEHKIEIDPAFEESLYRHPAGTKVSLYAYPAADVALGNVRAAIAALTPAVTPRDYLHPGARVEWQDSVGRWWPATIDRHRPESYDAKLDDGCDALDYSRGRFRRLVAQKEGNGNGR